MSFIYDCWKHLGGPGQHYWEWRSDPNTEDYRPTFKAYWDAYVWSMRHLHEHGPSIERFNSISTEIVYDAECYGALEDVLAIPDRGSPFDGDFPDDDEHYTTQYCSMPTFCVRLTLNDADHEAFKVFAADRDSTV
ncbi:hypothetical protein P0D69_33015 [Paraburkholderia sediminicola]|uniref:hypothetical protein n=1 Tax=Paraburkholderia sediminicola TaxID=458836 RepID=UPI0038B70E47